jgi:hypothetical protein
VWDTVEDGDIAEWSGSTGDYSADGNGEVNGTYSILHSGSDGGHIYRGSDLGDTQRATMECANPDTVETWNHKLVVNEATDGTHDGYFLRWGGSGDVQLGRFNGGSETILSSKDSQNYTNYPTQFWEIFNSGGTLEINIYDQQDGSVLHNLTGSDSNHTTGGAGLDEGADNSYSDDILHRAYADPEPSISVGGEQ